MQGYEIGDYPEINAALTFEQLCQIALRIVRRLEAPVAMVSGPITTGGLGSIEKNIQRLDQVISELQSGGVSVFNQMAFEDSMQRIKATSYYKGGNHLLETFYLPIFESGLIQTIYFLPDWQSSYGATWEHAHATRLELACIYL